MKQRDLLRSLREQAARDRIIMPGRVGRRKNRAWPICLTCGREPYAVSLEDVGTNRVEIRVKCGHKPYESMADNDRVFEDSARFDIPFGADRNEHIGWALRSHGWFNPSDVPK